jgi:hypothetical protein
MNLHCLNRFILAAAVGMGVAACNSSPTKSAAPQPPQPAVRADALATEALGVYKLQQDGARAWTLMSAATQEAPNRADLAFLQMRLCQLIEGCQPEPYEARARKLDPSNAAVWMRSLADAQRRREPTVEAQVLDAMGRGQRFDVYWNPLAAHIAAVRIANSARPSGASNETIDWLGATLIPNLQPLTLACSRSRTTESQWAQRCGRVAQALMNGDTYLAESLGTRMAQQVAAHESEQIKLSERSRTSRYLWRVYAELANSQVERDKFAAEILELMGALRREQDVHLAVVRWAGRPIVPPADWNDQ